MTRPSRDQSTHAAICFALLAMLCVVAVGCSRAKDLNSTYGQRRGFEGGESVNGTAVLAGLFEQAGYRVFTWKRLSPKLDQADVIVWAPNDFRPPNKKQREFLESWLTDDPGRTLIYVGRDFDAASEYWRIMRQNAPPEEAAEIARRLAVSQSEHDRRRARMPEEQFVRWFTVRRENAPITVTKLEGPWAADIDASKTDFRVEGRFDIPQANERAAGQRAAAAAAAAAKNKSPGNAVAAVDEDELYVDVNDWRDWPDYEPLLRSDDIVLVNRVTEDDWDGSQILVVTNGSFLLNMSLVNHEHRKLAGKLINACGNGRVAAFVESGPYGIDVYDEEPNAKYPTGIEMFTKWPIAPITLHFAMLGIIACFCLLPIFGRPRDPDSDSPSDFGKHIEALGRLLSYTRDIEYARARLRQFYEQVKGEVPAEFQEPFATVSDTRSPPIATPGSPPPNDKLPSPTA